SARQFSARAETERKFLAPHFVQQVLATEKGGDGIVTTLDLKKQELIERRMADYIRGNHNRGIQNAAALLVDVRTMDVLAQVGSADFFNAQIQGQVDGTRSSRSPGSTLKPFIYALALDQGLIHPLAIPLGGAEIKMEDLARLYAALSNNGELRPLRRKAGDPMPGHGHQIVTPEAAFLTLEMLNVPRPEINYADSGNVAPVFWKTGTSHGFHDAWSIAVFNHYVLAVWIGNLDGKPDPAIIGPAATAPLLF